MSHWNIRLLFWERDFLLLSIGLNFLRTRIGISVQRFILDSYRFRTWSFRHTMHHEHLPSCFLIYQSPSISNSIIWGRFENHRWVKLWHHSNIVGPGAVASNIEGNCLQKFRGRALPTPRFSEANFKILARVPSAKQGRWPVCCAVTVIFNAKVFDFFNL